ncbi:MAG: phosphoribosylformylglycinamidine synthase-associated small membrane protein [Hyphomicrobium sp.]
MTEPQDKKKRTDAEEALRFMAIKAAIFILIPAIAAGVAAYWVLK